MKRIGKIAGETGAKLRDRGRSVKLRVLDIARAARSRAKQSRERRSAVMIAIAFPWRACGEDKLLQHARDLYRAERANDLRALTARKIEDLRYYDVPNMDRAVAICFWGRSGSLLLSSYLDGHDQVVMLPTDRSDQIYKFFERYQSFSLHDKLLAYPIFISDFFEGEFPIVAAEYYAAVDAIMEVYGNASPQTLETGRAFFQFLHVACGLAQGRRPANTRPLMVYAQHFWHDEIARRFIEDFPQAQFLHTVRDPISTFDRTFERWLTYHWLTYLRVDKVPFWVIKLLTRTDQPHRGVESRTRAIRFEDLHNRTAETISRVLSWLSLPYHSAVLHSTFNGIPFVVERAGVTWSGPRPEQALRYSRNISFTDRALLYAMLYEDFIAWNYPCPKIFRHTLVRGLTFVLLLLIPMKAEIICARAAIKALPPIRHGNLQAVFICISRILMCRLGVMWLVADAFCRRCILEKVVLKLF
jgi:Sulfotransferase family